MFSKTQIVRASMVVMAAGTTLSSGANAGVQPSFTGLNLAAGMQEMKPIGVVGSGDDIYIPYKAIKEQGVQIYETGGVLAAGTFFEMPVPTGPNGEIHDVENVQYRKLPPRGVTRPGQTIPGIDIIVKKTPAGKAAIWDTRDSDEGQISDLTNPHSAVSWPNSLNVDGTVIAGAVHGDIDGQGESRHAARWVNGGGAELMNVPAGTRFSEVWGVSGNGDMMCGAITENGMPSDKPKLKPGSSVSQMQGMLWHAGGYTVVDPIVAGPDAESLALTGLNDGGTVAMATISTTRSNSKGGLYRISSGEFTVLDAGDINGDGVIDFQDDHNSDVLAMSETASVVGGTIGLVPGEEIAALWTAGPGGAYTYQDVATFLSDMGVTSHIGWTLNAVTGVSSDGQTIAGWGTSPMGQVTGWVVSIPTPGSVALLGVAGLAMCRRRRLC